jgi:hypothetical protein
MTKKDKYALIAGGSNLPLQIIKQLIKDKKDFVVFALKDYSDLQEINKLTKNVTLIEIGQTKKTIKKLQALQINKLIFAGSVKKPSITSLKLDSITLKFLLKIAIKGSGDDQLFKALIDFLKPYGFDIVSTKDICPSLFLNTGIVTKTKPNKIQDTDIEKGIKILKETSHLDIGQAIIIEEGSVLGLEAIEGTEALITRCKNLKLNKKTSGVLIKQAKKGQTEKIDLPTVGIKTIQILHKNNFAGIAIEAKSVQVIDKDAVIKEANKLKIFIKSF